MRVLKASALAVWLLVPAQPASGESLGDANAALVARGISPTLEYEGDFASNLSGGAARGSTYEGALHLQALVDGAKLFGWDGVMFYADVIDIHGGQPSGLVGDAQGVSNIAGAPAARLYEAWVEYNGPGGRVSILAGRYDVNTEFYNVHSAGLFLNSSFGMGPEFAQSGRAGPSVYPLTSIGARLTFKPAPWIVLRTAILDGVPRDAPAGASLHDDGALIVSELALLNRPGAYTPGASRRSFIGRLSSNTPYEDKVAIGAWYYTASFDDLSETVRSGAPRRHQGSGGAYMLVDKRLYTAPGDGGAELSAFLQAGIGDDRVNRFGSYLGFGVTGRGLIPGRPDDEVGLAAAIGRNGSHFMAEQDRFGLPADAAETTLDLSYSCQATPWLAVHPDLQYVIDPGTDPKLANATVFQLQAEVSL